MDGLSRGIYSRILRPMGKDIYPLKLFIKRVPVMIMTGFAVALLIFDFFWIFAEIPASDNQIFLHYNILFGVDLIGKGWRLYSLPGLGFIIAIINFLIGWLAFSRDRFIAYLMQAASLVCALYITVSVALLILLNT